MIAEDTPHFIKSRTETSKFQHLLDMLPFEIALFQVKFVDFGIGKKLSLSVLCLEGFPSLLELFDGPGWNGCWRLDMSNPLLPSKDYGFRSSFLSGDNKESNDHKAFPRLGLCSLIFVLFLGQQAGCWTAKGLSTRT